MLHNRSVKVALDSFCKATYKPARGGEKAGKYATHGSHRELRHPAAGCGPTTTLVMLKVLCEARWGETANLTGR
jgi:hypothetical protein